MLLLAALALLLALARAIQDEIYTGCQQEGQFAFTFDQGPSQHTGLLLRTLEKYKVRTTFHVLTEYLSNPVILAYLRKACTEGHLIGMFIKEDMRDDEKRLMAHLKHNASIIKKHCNYEPQFLRFAAPGPSPNILQKVSQAGYTVTSYNLDSQDYAVGAEERSQKEGSVFRTFKGIVDQIDLPSRGAFISVQNDLVEASVRQADSIIAYVIRKGYTPVRLDTCISKPVLTNINDNGANGESKKNVEEEREGVRARNNSNAANATIPKDGILTLVIFTIMLFDLTA